MKERLAASLDESSMLCASSKMITWSVMDSSIWTVGKEGGREGGMEEGREGGRDGGREGGREEGEREGERERGRS